MKVVRHVNCNGGGACMPASQTKAIFLMSLPAPAAPQETV